MCSDYIHNMWSAGLPDVCGEPVCPEIIGANIFMNKTGLQPGPPEIFLILDFQVLYSWYISKRDL